MTEKILQEILKKTNVGQLIEVDWVFVFAKWCAYPIFEKRGEIEKWVRDKKDKYRHPSMQGLTRDRAYNAMTEESALLNALQTFITALLPEKIQAGAEVASMMVEWAIKATLIYAIEYLYNEEPKDLDEFATDILAVIAGDTLLEKAIDYAIEKIEEPIEDYIETGKALLKWVSRQPKIKKKQDTFKKKLYEMLGKKLIGEIPELSTAVAVIKKGVKELGKEYSTVVKVLSALLKAAKAYFEIVGVAIGARVYCFKFPPLSGTYINLTAEYGAALVFKKDGSVDVRPRFPSQGDDDSLGDIRKESLGKGTYMLYKDILIIKFGTVSWEQGGYNPRPNANDYYPYTNWDFYNVEDDLNNKTINLTRTGECEFRGLRENKWEIMSYIADNSYKVIRRLDSNTKTVAVTFDPNNGMPKTVMDFIVGSGYSAGYELPSASKTGYKFEGWWTEDGTKVNKTLKVPDKDHTLYAHWKPKTVKVSFDAKGGTPSPSSRDVTFGSEYGTLPIVTKDGQVFLGWYYETSGGSRISSKDKMEKEEDNLKLYAQWSPASGIMVTFNPNGGNASSTTKNLSPGYPYGSLPHITKPGSRFHGWFTDAKGGIKVDEKTVFTGGNTLYAHWIGLNDIIVSFDARGPGNPEDIVISKSASTYGTLPTVTRGKYKFDGWFTKPEGGTKVESTTKAPEKDHTLYAHWSEVPTSVKVTFHKNGGTSAAISVITTAYNSKVTLPKEPTWPGYTFDSWNTRKDGSGTTFNEKTPVSADMEVYAKWKKAKEITYTVTFHKSDGDTPRQTKTVTPPATTIDALPTKPTKTGHDFDSWYTKSGEKETPFTASTRVKGDMEVYPKWKEAPKTVKVTFHRNGGTSAEIQPITTACNSKVTLPKQPTWPGHTFESWNTRKDGSGTTFNERTPVTANIAVYAKWTEIVPKNVKVTFEADGGKPSPASKTLKAGSKYDTLPKVTKDGYKFGGWFDKASGGTEVKSTSKAPEKDHTLYARWTRNTVTVTFHRNGEGVTSAAISSITTACNSKITLPKQPIRPGYTFNSWNTRKDGSGTTFNEKTPVTADIEVYARWTKPKPVSVKVTFEADGGKPSPAIKKVDAGSKYDTLPKVAKDGCKFEGWFTAAKSGTEVKSTTKAPEKDHTLYAHWTRNTVTVTFHRNGDGVTSAAIKAITTACNSKITLPKQPIRPGYTFASWNTRKDGSGTTFNEKTPVTADIEVYARWTKPKPVSVKVTFEAGGGKPSPASRKVDAGSKYDTLPKVTKDGYIFGGWFDKASGGTEVKSTSKAPEKDHTLYARWTKPKTVKVTFHRNGEGVTSAAISSITTAYNSKITLPKQPTRPGYTFASWNTKKDGSGTTFNEKTPVTADIEVYARWTKPKPVSVKVTFEADGGKPSPASKKVEAGSKYDTLPKVTKDGYKFGGWFTAAKSGTEVKSTSKAPEKDHTLYARWTRNTVTVTFHRNGDGVTSGAIPPKTTACNSKVTLPKQPTRPGYTFASWNTKKDGSGTTFNEKTPVTADIEVFARWTKPKPTSVKVTFEADGGKPSPASKKVEAGSKYDTLPKVTKDRYEFKGWFTAAKSGTEVKSTTKAPEKDHTLYAHWTPPPPPPKPTPSNAHDSYCPSKVGMTLTYAHTSYGAYGGTTYSTQTVKDVKSSGNNMTVTLATSTLDKNRKPGSSHTHKQTVKNGVMVMDPNQMMAELQSGSAMDFKGEPIELPNDIKPGQSFKIPEINMTTDVGAEKVKGVMKFEGKCVAIEDVKVPAGTFKCRKISLKATATAMGMTTVMTSVMWEAPNIGHVKSEHHHDKIGLLSRSELVEIKGR